MSVYCRGQFASWRDLCLGDTVERERDRQSPPETRDNASKGGISFEMTSFVYS